eukprot:765499-Hanusia_phi.AAC.4
MSRFPISFVFFCCAILLASVLQLSEGAPAAGLPSSPAPSAPPSSPLVLRSSIYTVKVSSGRRTLSQTLRGLQESKEVAFVAGRKSLRAIAEDALDGLSVCLGVAVLGAALTLPL